MKITKNKNFVRICIILFIISIFSIFLILKHDGNNSIKTNITSSKNIHNFIKNCSNVINSSNLPPQYLPSDYSNYIILSNILKIYKDKEKDDNYFLYFLLADLYYERYCFNKFDKYAKIYINNSKLNFISLPAYLTITLDYLSLAFPGKVSNTDYYFETAERIFRKVKRKFYNDKDAKKDIERVGKIIKMYKEKFKR